MNCRFTIWRSYRDHSADIGQPGEYCELLTTMPSGQSEVAIVYCVASEVRGTSFFAM